MSINRRIDKEDINYKWVIFHCIYVYIAAAAKSPQLCPTLCDPIDSSPPGSAIPGILQARTLEWVDISFSIVWKWKVKVKSLSHDWLVVTPWTAAHQAPPSMGLSRQEYWSGLPLPSPMCILPSHKKEWNNAICSNMDGPRDFYTKWSESERERLSQKEILHGIVYMWHLKKWYKWTYLQNRNRLTDIENKLMVTKEEEGIDKSGIWD